jgi:hypothetical protein
MLDRVSVWIYLAAAASVVVVFNVLVIAFLAGASARKHDAPPDGA